MRLQSSKSESHLDTNDGVGSSGKAHGGDHSTTITNTTTSTSTTTTATAASAPARRGSLTNMLFKRRSAGSLTGTGGAGDDIAYSNNNNDAAHSTRDSFGSSVPTEHGGGISDPSPAFPNFIYVAADKDFHRPALSALGSKSHAEVLQGKLFRKTGSCRVMALSEACSAAWAPHFFPAPSLHCLYRRHPFDEARYIGVRIFHSVIFDEKRQEMCAMLRGLGAKSISWMDGQQDAPLLLTGQQQHLQHQLQLQQQAGVVGGLIDASIYSSWTRQFEVPDTYGPQADEGGLHFLPSSPAWRDVISERFASWPDSTTFIFTYDDDFGLNDKLVSVLLTKLQISPAQFWAGSDGSDASSIGQGVQGGSSIGNNATAASMSGHSIYHNHSVPVQVVFFSRQEYTEQNRRHIASHWTAFHLEAFLKMSGLSRCLKLMLKHNITVPMLLGATTSKELNSMMHFRHRDSLTCMTLFSKLRALGDPEEADFLYSIDIEARRLQELRLPDGAREDGDYYSDASSDASSVSADSPSRPVASNQASPPTASARIPDGTAAALHILNEVTVAPVSAEDEVRPEQLEPAEYTLVMVGSSGVGKTSLLRQLVAITVAQSLGTSSVVTSIASGIDSGGSSIGSPSANTTSSSSAAMRTTSVARGDFNENELPTVGAQLLKCSVGRVTVESWDTAGQDSQRRAVIMHTKRADIIFFVYDVREPQSLEHLHGLAKDVIRNGCVPWVSLCLLGNKADLLDRKVSMLDGIEFAKKYGFSNFFETSARTGLNIYSAFLNSVLKCEQGRRAASHRRSFADAISLDAMYRGGRAPSKAVNEEEEEEEEGGSGDKKKSNGWSCC